MRKLNKQEKKALEKWIKIKEMNYKQTLCPVELDVGAWSCVSCEILFPGVDDCPCCVFSYRKVLKTAKNSVEEK
jgi:hypothetical protein